MPIRQEIAMPYPASLQAEAEAQRLGLPVDEAMFFQTVNTQILCAIIDGKLDLRALASEELANRGFDRSGQWVGFQKAAEVHGLMDVEREQHSPVATKGQEQSL
jgi:hypothetical protein